jgi:hypothetical protein
VIVAVVSESSVDESAVRTLLAPLIGSTSAEETGLPPIRTRPGGWSSLLKLLPKILRHLHYHTHVDAIVVVIDCDDSTPHGAHNDNAPEGCRLCLIRSIIDAELPTLTAIPNRRMLVCAIGLCVPAIEAWYLCGHDATVTEAAWINGHKSGQKPYSRRDLKLRVYGSATPDLDTQMREALKHANRHAADLSVLRTWFPHGCGTMLKAVSDWTG